MDTHELLTSRRTIHKFRDDPVPEEAIERALEAAIHAPNHKLTEPWRFHRLGPETRERLADLMVRVKGGLDRDEGKELSPEREAAIRAKAANAPVMYAVAQVRDDDPVRAREDYASVACAIHNMSLSLWAEGIGMKWSTGRLVHKAPLTETLGLDPEEERVVGIIRIGLPAEVPDPGRTPACDKCLDLP